jgi:hypothetical protein
MPSIPFVWLLSWRLLPQFDFFKTKRREEERRERERKEKKKEGKREKKGRRGASKQPPLNGSSAARAYGLCSFAKRCTKAWIVFIFFARSSYVGEAFFCFLACSQVQQNAFEGCFTAGRWPNLLILNQIWPLNHNHGICLWYRWVPPWDGGLGVAFSQIAR